MLGMRYIYQSRKNQEWNGEKEEGKDREISSIYLPLTSPWWLFDSICSLVALSHRVWELVMKILIGIHQGTDRRTDGGLLGIGYWIGYWIWIWDRGFWDLIPRRQSRWESVSI